MWQRQVMLVKLQDTPAVFDMIRFGLGQNSISVGKSGHIFFAGGLA